MTNVIPFPAERAKVLLSLPPDLAKLAQKGAVDMVTLNGDSLQGIGLFDGDQVLCKTAFSKREIGRNTVCLVKLRSNDEIFVKRVEFRPGEIVLRSFSPDICDINRHADDVEIQGIVVQLLLPMDPRGDFFRERPSVDRRARYA